MESNFLIVMIAESNNDPMIEQTKIVMMTAAQASDRPRLGDMRLGERGRSFRITAELKWDRVVKLIWIRSLTAVLVVVPAEAL